MSKKRIYNPKTKTYYQIRQKSTKSGKKGQIISKWSNESAKSSRIKRISKKVRSRYSSVIKELAKE